MLDAIERKQKVAEALEQQMKEMRKAKKSLPGGTLENYAAMVNAKVEKYEDEHKGGVAGLTDAEMREATDLLVKNGEISDPNLRQMGQSRRAYYRELKKVLEAADVIIEVLDARDPEGCRNKELEQ